MVLHFCGLGLHGLNSEAVTVIVILSTGKFPSKFMIVTMWEHYTFANQIFDSANIYVSKSIIIINFV
jgi:hypothetical protein